MVKSFGLVKSKLCMVYNKITTVLYKPNFGQMLAKKYELVLYVLFSIASP